MPPDIMPGKRLLEDASRDNDRTVSDVVMGQLDPEEHAQNMPACEVWLILRMVEWVVQVTIAAPKGFITISILKTS